MLSDVTFGQYYQAESFVHKMDPRVKILLLIAYIVMVFVAKTFLGLFATLAFLLVTVVASRVPIGSVLRSIKAIIFLVVFTAILNICFYSPKAGDTHLFWVVYTEGLISAGFFNATFSCGSLSSAHSSTMDLQISTHSSQMQTPSGPLIRRFVSSFCFPQKEQ